ncbi:MAG: hypothetical protein ACKVQK_19520 [Burkholderiales bacterium]
MLLGAVPSVNAATIVLSDAPLDLGFIDYKTVGPTQYVLIFNPYKVAKARRQDIQEGTYAALYAWALEIGAAEDFED